MVKAILFDLGGTLLRYAISEYSFIEMSKFGIAALYQYLQPREYPLPTEDLFCQIVSDNLDADWHNALATKTSVSLASSVRDSLHVWGIEIPDEELYAALWRYYEYMAPYVGIYDDTTEVLMALHRRGLKLGMVSNTVWTRAMHDADLQRFDILHFLPYRTYSSEVAHIKPHAAIFQRALDAMNVAPRDAVFVGDRLLEDVSGSQAVGMAAVLKLVPERKEVSDTIIPDARIANLRELLVYLESL